jgi:hypothetical protein
MWSTWDTLKHITHKNKERKTNTHTNKLWGHAPHDGSSSNQPFGVPLDSASTRLKHRTKKPQQSVTNQLKYNTQTTPPQHKGTTCSETHCVRPLITNSCARYHDHPVQWILYTQLAVPGHASLWLRVAQCGRIPVLVEMLPFCEYNDLSWIFCEA